MQFCDVFKKTNPNLSLYSNAWSDQSHSVLYAYELELPNQVDNIFYFHKCNFFNLATAFILTYNSFSHKRILALISGLLLDSHVHDVAFFAGH